MTGVGGGEIVDGGWRKMEGFAERPEAAISVSGRRLTKIDYIRAVSEQYT